MDNLTMRNSSGLVVPTKLNMEYISKMPLGDWGNWIEILDKLRDYEDTGCSPEEVKEKRIQYVYVLTKICSVDGLRSVRIYSTHEEARNVMKKEYKRTLYNHNDLNYTTESSLWMAQAYDMDNRGFDWNITKVKLSFGD